MNAKDLEILSERYNTIQQIYILSEEYMKENEIKIVHWSEDIDEHMDVDPWVIADQAEMLVKSVGIRGMRDKDLALLAFKGEELIGCTLSSTTQNDEGVLYDFDVAVSQSSQTMGIGSMLVKASIQEANNSECNLIRCWVINPKMANILEKFGFDFESSPDTRDNQYNVHMVKYL